jgi:hypothetical protein
VLCRNEFTELHPQTQAEPRKPNQRDRIKLGCKLYKYFHGGRTDIYFADDDHGRSRALAFAVCGFRNKALIADAPWLADENRLRALRREARKFTFDDIGLLIHMDDKARDDCKAAFSSCRTCSRTRIARGSYRRRPETT